MRFNNSKENRALVEHLYMPDGIYVEFTIFYTPELNSPAKRLNRTLITIARCMIIKANVL